MSVVTAMLTQAQPTPSPTDLRPVLLTAGGALGGIVLTLFIQLINGALQRRHEHRGRSFDARLEVYSRFIMLHDELARLTRELIDDPSEEGIQARASRFDAVIKSMSEVGGQFEILATNRTSKAFHKVYLAAREGKRASDKDVDEMRQAIRSEPRL